MEKVKILVVEDEVIIADHLADTLEALGYETLEPAIDFAEAVATIEEERPDIAILDIQLSGRKNGVDLAEKINSEYHFPFIFLTSNSDRETLEEAKLANPSAFLIKPFSKEELYASIEVALYNYSQQRQKAMNRENLIIKDALFIKQNKIYLRVNFNEILYLVSDHVYLDIVMVDGKKHTVRGSLNEYIAKLGETFIRSHRSYIVNLEHLEGINHGYVILKGQELPLGKRHREDIIGRLNRG